MNGGSRSCTIFYAILFTLRMTIIMDSSYYEYEWDIGYCYPKSNILKNKLNIIDNKDLLDEAERQITAFKILDLKMKPFKGNLDTNHLFYIHKYIFEDIYSWAGKSRCVNIAKGNQFCNCVFIEDKLAEIFIELLDDKYLIGVSQDLISKKLSYYLSELNAIHPFREGNGRTQRIFIEYLSNVAGFHVDFSDISPEEMIEASVDSFFKNYEKMDKIFKKITKPISKKEQEHFINLIAPKNSDIRKIYSNFKDKM